MSETRRFLSALTVVLFVMPALTFAFAIDVSPKIINLKAAPRENVVGSVLVGNNGNFRTDVYVFIKDVHLDGTEKESTRPGSINEEYFSSLAGWISIPRSFKISPKESQEISFGIEPSLKAEPGIYHAVMLFSYGNTRSEAEKRLESAPRVTINMEIADNLKEVLVLKKFLPEKTFFTGFPITFNYLLENKGDVETAFEGEIIVYDRRGREIANVPISDPNGDGPVGGTLSIKPSVEKFMGSSLSSIDGFGSYKAVLDVRYGNEGSIRDTAFFWVIPVHLLIFLFFVLVGFFVFLIYAIHLRYERWYHYHYAKQLHARGISSGTKKPSGKFHTPTKESSDVKKTKNENDDTGRFMRDVY